MNGDFEREWAAAMVRTSTFAIALLLVLAVLIDLLG